MPQELTPPSDTEFRSFAELLRQSSEKAYHPIVALARSKAVGRGPGKYDDLLQQFYAVTSDHSYFEPPHARTKEEHVSRLLDEARRGNEQKLRVVLVKWLWRFYQQDLINISKKYDIVNANSLFVPKILSIHNHVSYLSDAHNMRGNDDISGRYKVSDITYNDLISLSKYDNYIVQFEFSSEDVISHIYTNIENFIDIDRNSIRKIELVISDTGVILDYSAYFSHIEMKDYSKISVKAGLIKKAISKIITSYLNDFQFYNINFVPLENENKNLNTLNSLSMFRTIVTLSKDIPNLADAELIPFVSDLFKFNLAGRGMFGSSRPASAIIKRMLDKDHSNLIMDLLDFLMDGAGDIYSESLNGLIVDLYFDNKFRKKSWSRSVFDYVDKNITSSFNEYYES